MPRPASPHRRRPGARPMVAALAAATLLTTGVASSSTTAAASAAPVAPELVAQVENARSGDPVRALLMLPNTENLTGDRTDVLDTLRGHAAETQAEVESHLEQQDITVLNRFWLTNMVLVEFPAASQNLDALASTPGVDRVIPNFELTAPDPAPNSTDVAPNAELTWGLQKIEAARVWDELGIDGSGVRVATLDTGVDITHPDLAGKMVTDNPADPNHPGGWMEFNATGGRVASAPHDSAYHGTHVSGTIHGGATSGTAIGVATGAELMHGLVIPGGSGSFAQVAAGMQWAIAPTDAAGNPAGQPADVVNMSLGANGFYPEMIQPTRAMRAAGVFPAFSIGNNCATGGTGSPGNVFEAVGVGATDETDNVAGFSCGGVVRKNQWASPPAEWPESWVKPDVSAPGVDVYSASPGGGYRTLSGTSMAAPHTAGTVALMRSAAGDLSVDEIVDVLGDTAFWDDRYATTPPDTRFGIGRINAFEATSFVALNSGIEGAVTDAAGAPVAGATVTVAPGDVTVTTGADGTFTRRLAPGTYEVTVEAFGYRATTVSDVTVAENSFAAVEVALDAAPGGQVVGRAVLTEGGHGVPGVKVQVTGVPVDLSAVTGADGTYTIPRVPSGTYEIVASHPTFRAPGPVEVTVSPDAAARADFGFGVPSRSVAIVDSSASRAAQYRDVVFAPLGIETAIYNWNQLPQAAAHATVILGYGTLSIDYDEADFQAFLAATDAGGTGVIFTDHSFGSGNGIKQLSEHTGQPVAYDSDSGGASSAQSYYEVTQEHPMLDGYSVGDRIVIDGSTQPKWVAWFDGYEGEGRKLLGTLGRTVDGTLGGGIGVDERATNRHVLLSTHGVSSTRGPDDWTPEATDLFLNAITWASPPPAPNQPYFAPHNLRATPDLVMADDDVRVQVDVKNIGGTAGKYDAVLRVNGAVEATTAVTLAPGGSTTVTWTLSRDDLGIYTAQVGHLSDTFRVRAPIVQLSTSTVDAPGAAAVGALAGATVELIDDGQVHSLGTTGADGKLTFEIPDPVGRYTLVVRRPTPADGGPGYLLHREITVIDDESISFAPRVLAGGARAAGVGDDFAVRATIDLDSTDDRHSGSVFLRPSGTAPHGYRYQPGTLIASLDRYEAVAVHEVLHLEQDWLMPSRVVGGIDWIDPFDTTFSFGGAPTVSIGDVTVGEDGQTTVPWSVTDAHGLPFATVLASDVRPFYTLPERVVLEDVEGLLRAAVPNELKPILRLFDPAGTPLRAGAIGWNAQPYTFAFDPNAPDGEYRLALDVATGGYAGQVSDETSLRIGPVPVSDVSISDTRPGTAVPGTAMRYDVLATNAGTADSGPVAWTVRVSAGHALVPQNVVLRVQVDGAWQRVQLRRDGGALVGTVVADASVAAAAARTWKVSVQFQGSGTYTVADSFAGTGVAVSNADTITVAAPVPVGTR